ncbi:hypothetical protein TrLO_g2679 [Triparma laevis f. longispina]|uniref:Uncharacterized protein n=1 Tax=Triparma laevis f. longispina TaxID=1714387 RepID=A0A9W7DU89_9STRA|nr:hypothetical protein TrLO_g2679 [Triparma laevis f. longispina]
MPDAPAKQSKRATVAKHVTGGIKHLDSGMTTVSDTIHGLAENFKINTGDFLPIELFNIRQDITPRAPQAPLIK